MKRLNHTITGIALVLTLLSSCKQLIEIPAAPPNQIAESLQFADSASTIAAALGSYAYTAYDQGFTYNNAFLTMSTGLSSDEFSSSRTYSTIDQEFFNYSLTPLNGNVKSMWERTYSSLYPVNATIRGVMGNNAISKALRDQVTGELKVVRALYYFNMLNLFGAVPLVTSTEYKATARIPRTSADSIYGQIMADLTEAKQLLKANYAGDGRIRPNLYTAQTLLAKVHLYRKEWQKAYDEAGTVITSGMYGLETDLDNVFLEGSNEAIWQIPAVGYYSVTSEATNFVPGSGSIPNFPLTSFLLNAFETNDQRLQKWVGRSVVNSGSQSNTYYFPYKYKQRIPPAGTAEGFVIFRLGELYLIRAEAAAQLGKTAEALDDLDMIRGRAGLLPSTATTKDNILTAIMHERQTELFAEWGNRWFDLKRTGTAGTVLSAEKTNWKSRDVLYPVPQAQRQLDDLLTQNTGYN